MKALRLTKPKKLELQDVTPRNLPKGWCRVRVLAVGVCGSDVSSILGKLPFTKYPVTPGHEFSGVVAETRDCSTIKKGMFVTANPIFSCGKCPECLRGNIQHCAETEVMGVVHYDGAYAEEVLIPERMASELPEDMTVEEGAMVEPVTVAVQAVERAGVAPGSSVAVFGAGNIGLLVIQVARAYGAKRVVVMDPVQSRLDAALALGADTALTPRAMEQNKGEYQSAFTQIIDGVGSPDTIALGIALAAPGGVLTVYGVPAPGELPVSVLGAFKKDMTIATSRLYPRSLDKAISLIAEGKLDFGPMITHRTTLAGLPGLIEQAAAKEIDSIKIMVQVGEK